MPVSPECPGGIMISRRSRITLPTLNVVVCGVAWAVPAGVVTLSVRSCRLTVRLAMSVVRAAVGRAGRRHDGRHLEPAGRARDLLGEPAGVVDAHHKRVLSERVV